MPPLLDRLAPALVTALASTWRLEVVGDAQVRGLRDANVPLIFTVWHAFLLPPLWHRRGERITLLVSDHGDASQLALAAEQLGYRIVRGSSTRGAVKGTKGLLRALAGGGDIALTPDGPTGPPRIAKPGAIALATRARAAIVPIGAGASSWWRLGSWDRFAIPRPFSRVRVVYGDPLRVDTQSAARDASLLNTLGVRLEEATGMAAC